MESEVLGTPPSPYFIISRSMNIGALLNCYKANYASTFFSFDCKEVYFVWYWWVHILN